MNEVKILVCVTGQKNCTRLIEEGARLARELDGSVSVVHVAPAGETILGNPKEFEAIEWLYHTAKEAGADMAVLRAEHVQDVLVRYAQEQHADLVVLGIGTRRGSNSLAEQLRARLPGVEIRTVMTQEA